MFWHFYRGYYLELLQQNLAKQGDKLLGKRVESHNVTGDEWAEWELDES